MTSCAANPLDFTCSCPRGQQRYLATTQSYVCCDVMNYAGEYNSACNLANNTVQAQVAAALPLAHYDGSNYVANASNETVYRAVLANPNSGLEFIRVYVSCATFPIDLPISAVVYDLEGQQAWASSKYVPVTTTTHQSRLISTTGQSINLVWCLIVLLVVFIAISLLVWTRPLIKVVREL